VVSQVQQPVEGRLASGQRGKLCFQSRRARWIFERDRLPRVSFGHGGKLNQS
jgi:hypothetical protein